MPLEGGQSTKLNDIQSHWLIVYRDKIYYQEIRYTLRCMNLDGSEDEEIAKIRYNYPVLCDNKLCLIDESNKGVVSYLELDHPEAGMQFAEGVCGCARYGEWNTYFWTDGMVVYHK